MRLPSVYGSRQTSAEGGMLAMAHAKIYSFPRLSRSCQIIRAHGLKRPSFLPCQSHRWRRCEHASASAHPPQPIGVYR